MKEQKIINCECNGYTCCGGRGIAVFSVKRDRKILRVCTCCDLSSDKDRKILRYAKQLPTELLIKFDALGAVCLAMYIKNKDYPFTKKLYE